MNIGYIATLILLSFILLYFIIKVPEVLMMITFFALISGFCAILVSLFINGWFCFFSILWELVWFLISRTPQQIKLWEQEI